MCPAAIPFRMGWLDGGAASAAIEGVLATFITINLYLAIFNLLPIPPLDGSRVLAAVLPAKWARSLERLEMAGGGVLMILLLVLATSGVLSAIISPIVWLFLEWALY